MDIANGDVPIEHAAQLDGNAPVCMETKRAKSRQVSDVTVEAMQKQKSRTCMYGRNRCGAKIMQRTNDEMHAAGSSEHVLSLNGDQIR